MKEIGLFEAKTRLSEICSSVASNGRPVLITRRGKPLVKIEPLPAPSRKSKSVWERREAFEKKFGPLTEDFELPQPSTQTWRDPLAE